LLRISTARKLADIFWPLFSERDGAILPAWVAAASPPRGPDGTLTEHELFQSHTHIRDLFRWDVPNRYDPRLDLQRPDVDSPQHAEAWELAKRIGQMWFAKLCDDFPGYQFRVYVTRLDDPIIRFHRVRENEPVWITDEKAGAAIARGDIVIFDSSTAPNRGE
jgi:hypothetical protein